MKPWTEQNLRQAAYHYLARFASNRGRLVRVLRAKVARRGFEPGEEAEAAIARIAAACGRLGLMDEHGYAMGRARTLLARGRGPGSILADLRARDVEGLVAQQALDELMLENGGRESNIARSALALARRKKLGPFGDGDPRRDARLHHRQLGVFARAGIPFDMASRILRAEDEHALMEDLVASGLLPG